MNMSACMYVCELRSEEYLVRHLSFPLWKASIIALKYSPKGIRGARNYGFSNGTVIDGRSKSILVLFPASDIHVEIDTHVGLSSLLFVEWIGGGCVVRRFHMWGESVCSCYDAERGYSLYDGLQYELAGS